MKKKPTDSTITIPDGYEIKWIDTSNGYGTSSSATITTTRTTTSSGTGPIVWDSNSYTIPHFDDPFKLIYKNEKTECTCCKEKINGYMIEYKGPKLTRVLCNTCFRRVMDKLFKVQADFEEVLYGE